MTSRTGTLLTRILGQKKLKADGFHGSSIAELFTRLPTLRCCLLKHLQAATLDAHGRMRLQPALFPVLTILAKLTSGGATHRSAPNCVMSNSWALEY